MNKCFKKTGNFKKLKTPARMENSGSENEDICWEKRTYGSLKLLIILRNAYVT
jgi:hypothetical protein